VNGVTPGRTLRVPVGVEGVQTATREVPITDEQGGLALQRALCGPGWLVVHVASGRRVTPTYRLKAQARAVQRALLAVEGMDWRWDETRMRRLSAALRARVQAVVGLGETAR
jgi:hypothetical protein